MHRFELPGVEGEQPPGTYIVETIDEPIGGLAFVAYRRVSTTIVVAARRFGPGARQMVAIDPEDLEAVQKRDAAKSGAASDGTDLAGT